MQRANAQSGMGMEMRGLLRGPVPSPVNVDMGVWGAIMGMMMSMQPGGERFPQPPKPDGDQQNAYRSFTIRGDDRHGDELAQQQRAHADQPDATGVPGCPLQPH